QLARRHAPRGTAGHRRPPGRANGPAGGRGHRRRHSPRAPPESPGAVLFHQAPGQRPGPVDLPVDRVADAGQTGNHQRPRARHPGYGKRSPDPSGWFMSPRSWRPRLLVVDDDPGVLRAVQRVLGPSYELATAASPAEALAMVDGYGPDLAILDIRMPAMDGF